MVARSALLIVLGALIVAGPAAALVAAPSAGAAVLGPDSGVTAVRTGARIDVTFTPGALAGSRLKAGRSVEANCTVVPATTTLELADTPAETSDAAAAGHGYADGTVGADGVAHLKLSGDINDEQPGTLDSCEVERVHHITARATTSDTVARVPLTPAGVVYVDETERATALRRLLQKAHTAAGYGPVAGVVALGSPDATPPAGQVGYWTDGTHAAVATVSAAGRRLVIEDQGDYVLRSNVFDQMDPLGLDDADPSSVPDGETTSERIPDTDKRPSPYKGDAMLTPADGIRATVSGRRVTVRFTGRAARTFRALRGRRVTISCAPAQPRALFPSLLVLDTSLAAQGGYGVARVPRRVGAVTATLRGGTGDVCFVGDDSTSVALAGGTAAGKAWMQDALALQFLLDGDQLGLAAPGARSYRPTAQVVAAGRRRGLVAMSGPDGAVPVGRIGVWTDGARQAAVAVVSAAGHRFLVTDEGDQMGRTNILSAYSSLFLAATLSLSSDESLGSFVG